jgi:hypothetical protein
MQELVERHVTFNYNYTMSCSDCSGVTFLTADEYHSEPNGAHVSCVHCGGDIHFGPAVMALRDPADLMLDDQWVPRVAWYHTSPISNWPQNAHWMPSPEVEFLQDKMSADAIHEVRYVRENQALHLGTYEAAVESMLRRMQDQDDGGTQFYLYRVSLRRDGLIIEPGRRNENTDEISQVTQAELGESNVVRYLNVRESPGSISLAVRREAIGLVQGVALPVRMVEVPAASPLLREVADIRAQVEEIEVTRLEDDLDLIDRLQQKTASRQSVPFVRAPTPKQYALLYRICQLVADEYLPGVSLPVRDVFVSALDAWTSAQEASIDDVAYISRFASMAWTLTHSAEVIQMLKHQLVRDLSIG